MGTIKTRQKKDGGFDSRLVDSIIALYPRYGTQKKSRRLRPNEIRSLIRILRKAESIVLATQSFFDDKEVAKKVSAAIDVLKETAHALLRLGEGGRPPELQLGHCANYLAEMFKQDTGRYHWEWVGHAMAEGFPDALPPDDGRRDVSLWAYNLAKRYRELRTDKARLEREEMRGRLRLLRKRLADPHPKTIADFYPSPRKKSWPDDHSGSS
jgi:hypothetical protein